MELSYCVLVYWLLPNFSMVGKIALQHPESWICFQPSTDTDLLVECMEDIESIPEVGPAWIPCPIIICSFSCFHMNLFLSNKTVLNYHWKLHNPIANSQQNPVMNLSKSFQNKRNIYIPALFSVNPPTTTTTIIVTWYYILLFSSRIFIVLIVEENEMKPSLAETNHER